MKSVRFSVFDGHDVPVDHVVPSVPSSNDVPSVPISNDVSLVLNGYYREQRCKALGCNMTCKNIGEGIVSPWCSIKCRENICILKGCSKKRFSTPRTYQLWCSPKCQDKTCNLEGCRNIKSYYSCGQYDTSSCIECIQKRKCQAPGCYMRCKIIGGNEISPWCSIKCRDNICILKGCSKKRYSTDGTYQLWCSTECEEKTCYLEGCRNIKKHIDNEQNASICLECSQRRNCYVKDCQNLCKQNTKYSHLPPLCSPKCFRLYCWDLEHELFHKC